MTRHLGGIDDLSREGIEALLDRAEALRRGAPPVYVPGRVLTLAFFQTSTRTRAGFAAAGIRLGFGTVDLRQERFDASMAEPESFADTVRVASAYSDLMVLRHPSANAWDTALRVARCPLINGGNGGCEHPTQALIDLFAVRRVFGRLAGVRFAIVGDIVGSRSVHSLMKALRWFGPGAVRLIGPAPHLVDVREASWMDGFDMAAVTVTSRVDVSDVDVVYMAGLPRGVGADSVSEEERAAFALTPERLMDVREGAIVLCPLPRIDEIAPDVDDDRRTRYFEQSDDGLSVRMAAIEWTVGARG